MRIRPTERYDIVFVAQNPKGSQNAGRALVGTRSWEVLLSWTEEMGLSGRPFLVTNALRDFGPPRALRREERLRLYGEIRRYGPKVVVALGSLVSRDLTRAGVPHLRLPHPSGLNRHTSHKRALREVLTHVGEQVRSAIE